MREILFRGKTTKKEEGMAFNNIWTYGNFLKGVEKSYIQPRGNAITVDGELSKFMVLHEVIPATIGQYTGLTDMKDKKIYEGDIIQAHLDELYPENEVRLLVVFHEGRFMGKYRDTEQYEPLEPEWFVKKFMVIGNIYDDEEKF